MFISPVVGTGFGSLFACDILPWSRKYNQRFGFKVLSILTLTRPATLNNELLMLLLCSTTQKAACVFVSNFEILKQQRLSSFRFILYQRDERLLAVSLKILKNFRRTSPVNFEVCNINICELYCYL